MCVKGLFMHIAPMEANRDTYVKGSYFATQADPEASSKETLFRFRMQEMKDYNFDLYNEIL
jgi:hypothetical protein